MTRIVLDIEAGENGLCGECGIPEPLLAKEKDAPLFCIVFGCDVTDGVRCPACLAAEQEYKKFEALREAASQIPYSRGPRHDELRQALAALPDGRK